MLDLIDAVADEASSRSRDDSHNLAHTTSAGVGSRKTKSHESQDAVRIRRSRSTRVIPQVTQSAEARPRKLPALSRPSGSSEQYLETMSAPTPSSDVGNAAADDAASPDNDSSYLLPGFVL
jgi:hypothetical protein